MDFDLDNFDTRKRAEQGFELQLVDAKNLPAPEFITVQGVDSEAYQRAQDDRSRRQIKAAERTGKATMTPEEMKAAVMEQTVAVTVSWRGDKLGKVPFSKKAAEDLYTKFPVIFEQVKAAVADRANFSQGGSTSSSSSLATSSN